MEIASKGLYLAIGMSVVTTYKGYKICQYSSDGLQYDSARFKVYQGDRLVGTYLLRDRKWAKGVNNLNIIDANAIEGWVNVAYDKLMVNVGLTDNNEPPLDINIPVSKKERKKHYNKYGD